jgi:hypothetical protein
MNKEMKVILNTLTALSVMLWFSQCTGNKEGQVPKPVALFTLNVTPVENEDEATVHFEFPPKTDLSKCKLLFEGDAIDSETKINNQQISKGIEIEANKLGKASKKSLYFTILI